MRKGFTLIELLAVIVILAIIALIANPIVLSIINDSKQSTGIRSAEMYLSALQNSIATSLLNNRNLTNESYDILENGNVCIEYSESKCTTELEVEINGEVPSDGKITIKDGKILHVDSLKYGDNKISTDFDGNLDYIENRIICKAVTEETKTTGTIPQGKYVKGDEYKCKVSLRDNIIYTFFVLSINEDDTVNLLMERNIYYNSKTKESGLITNSNYISVKWQESGINADGPVTIINYLYNATSDWDNIPNIQINYIDDDKTGDYGYSNIITNDEKTTITRKDGTTSATYENLKARLPYKPELYNFDTTNLWMYNYLSSYADVTGENLQNISSLGYWTLTSNKYVSNFAWRAIYRGNIDSGTINIDNSIGVRPVITLKKSMLSE